MQALAESSRRVSGGCACCKPASLPVPEVPHIRLLLLHCCKVRLLHAWLSEMLAGLLHRQSAAQPAEQLRQWACPRCPQSRTSRPEPQRAQRGSASGRRPTCRKSSTSAPCACTNAWYASLAERRLSCNTRSLSPIGAPSTQLKCLISRKPEGGNLGGFLSNDEMGSAASYG